MLEALQGGIPCESDDDYVPQEKPKKARKKSATKGRKGKQPQVNVPTVAPPVLAPGHSEGTLPDSEADVISALTGEDSYMGTGSESEATVPPFTDNEVEGHTSGNVSAMNTDSEPEISRPRTSQGRFT